VSATLFTTHFFSGLSGKEQFFTTPHGTFFLNIKERRRDKPPQRMRIVWKPDKAPGRKREQKQRLERQQKRKDFAKIMERAFELSCVFCTVTDIATVPTGDLEQKYVDWAISQYRQVKFKEPMNQQHNDMDLNWREIVVTAKACAKATEARTYPKRMAKHKLAVAKIRADRTQSRIEAAERIGAEMQAKMQERIAAGMQAKMQEHLAAEVQAKMQEHLAAEMQAKME
jgi:hypothetical protein